MKQLRRAKEGRKIAGVCKGIANSLEIDVTYVRLGCILLAVLPFVTVFGVALLYALLAFIIPEEEDYIDV